MKANNLRVFDNELDEDVLLKYLKVHGIKLKSSKEKNRLKEEKNLKDEIACLKSLVSSMPIQNSGVELSNFFIGFNIPQINNEFDLLRFGSNFDINIELKGKNTGEKIVTQLKKQRHYLSIRERELWQFTYVKEENQLYETDGENLIKSDFKKLIELLGNQEIEEEVILEEIFEPSQFLISPFNTADKFLRGTYFLNSLQDEIKKKIMQSQEKYHVVTGIAGSGKTLLVYDIAKKYMEEKKKVVIIHAGNLNQGQNFLNSNGWDIKAAKESISEQDEIDVLIIDESQRQWEDQFNKIMEFESEIIKDKIILCGDDNQILAMDEEKFNISEKIKNKPKFNQHKLTKKVRTNEKVADFIKGLFDLKDMKSLDENSINIDYFETKEEAKNYVQYLQTDSTFLDYTLPPPGGKYDYPLYRDYQLISAIHLGIVAETSHEVIGQEFDSVTVCLGPHFEYRKHQLIFPDDRTNYYSASKMLFQNITRARKKINLIIFENEKLLVDILGAIK
ncbi:hypothetical protein Hs30E_04370 [Lactococcus hodotermopsidis]|uniref:Schlafen group 3-like DNA/RNA helicase domain-containing protein n=1 Tax=Pseudolactococcus hodotermopsidis TaxID=2709157 RepID=A0A6A0BAQ4_9LACT|nr:DNA/RNA helicase domain-containing protein [Lactococcus hodotermopsidis]GFH41886.1 hypothetical protein Hs30E_04370 [Lactococcus hodotermopsidis]